MRVYTAVYTAVNGPCTWRVRAVSDRVDGRVRAVYRDAGRVRGSCAVCYYDFLCKRHLLCRNLQLQIHYIQKELGLTSAPSAALRRTTVLRTMLIIG